MSRISQHLLIGIIVLASIAASANAQSQVELHIGEARHIGKPVAHNKQVCWLASTDGQYSQVLFSRVTEFAKYPKPFRAQSLVEAKNELKSELGKSFEVQIRGSFVIAGPARRIGKYADALEEMSRSFSRYISVRRLPIVQPEFPLIVVIFPDENSFAEYCRKDGMFFTPYLKGYYHPMTNRVALFESPDPRQRSSARGSSRSEATDLSNQTVSTLIHEGIHQLAFNNGLHSRIGQNPRWVVEGLATMLEADGILNVSRVTSREPINRSRLLRFQEYCKEQRSETIADFIAGDERYFQKSALDAYSQAWALTYFLAEEYSSNYARYLKTIAQRDPLKGPYQAEERLADFQSAFGKDLQWLEVKFIRFIDGLNANEW